MNIRQTGPDADAVQERLDRVFFALRDPLRRQILERLDGRALLDAALWMNRYHRYWQPQFDLLAATAAEIDERKVKPPAPALPDRSEARAGCGHTEPKSARPPPTRLLLLVFDSAKFK